MPGCQRSRSLAPSGAARSANAFSTPRIASTRSGARCRTARSRIARCNAADSGLRRSASGRASILPAPQPRLTAIDRSSPSSTVLPTPAQPGQHEAAFGTAAGHAFEHHLERADLFVPAGELRRPLACTGGERIAHRVHGSHRIGVSSDGSRDAQTNLDVGPDAAVVQFI